MGEASAEREEVAGADWRRRAERLWDTFDDHDAEGFRDAMRALVAELPAEHPLGLFELASAYDATDGEAEAAALYRRALAAGLPGDLRRQAVIQLASTLRNLGEVAASVELLRGERAAASDELDDAVDAFLALSLADAGREREAVALLLRALAGHLPRYRRSVTAYADGLTA
ncbi:tetratricopeptide repeat protein [Streptomyces litchfieldiae]|uniref:Tetratricopeptide repeat protein n=1 Tax=Streptomyces litchfieldiae TaxID=3075543 RepID=A0ABU2MJK9_9ACTN|nr:tetratricopeptide repeat protein [Streptomyces sp. DSM 44938]MDT0341725.1 tetratricopeptide repeat protein [Streptomyces sp. DSM 44938]